MNGDDAPPRGGAQADEWALLGEYVAARRRLLAAIGRPLSNRNPLPEWAEWLAAEVLGGQVSDNPVQQGWDVELPNGTRVQVKSLANSAGRGCWPNEHPLRFPANAEAERVDLYALAVFIDLKPIHLLVFHRAALGGIYDLLGKTHAERGQCLQLTRCDYEQIIGAREEFSGLVDVSWENPELA